MTNIANCKLPIHFALVNRHRISNEQLAISNCYVPLPLPVAAAALVDAQSRAAARARRSDPRAAVRRRRRRRVRGAAWRRVLADVAARRLRGAGRLSTAARNGVAVPGASLLSLGQRQRHGALLPL